VSNSKKVADIIKGCVFEGEIKAVVLAPLLADLITAIPESPDNRGHVGFREEKDARLLAGTNERGLLEFGMKLVREADNLRAGSAIDGLRFLFRFVTELKERDSLEVRVTESSLTVGEAINELFRITYRVNLCGARLTNMLKQFEMPCVCVLELVDEQTL
jgi:hypothetical protein